MTRRQIRVHAARLLRHLQIRVPDAHVYAGIGLVAFGAGEFHAALAPIVAGLGLLWIVRFGGEPLTRSGRR